MENSQFGMHDCLERGQAFENAARAVLERNGYETHTSTMGDDIYRHVDFWAVGIDGRSHGFDAKAMKSLEHGGPVQDEWAVVEWLNVGGAPGWLVRGCDLLVFERVSEIVVVRRDDLLQFCRRRTDRGRWATHLGDARYCLYRRVGRRDAISLFRFSDLDIPTKVFEK